MRAAVDEISCDFLIQSALRGCRLAKNREAGHKSGGGCDARCTEQHRQASGLTVKFNKLILGPHTIGPTVDVPELKALAEFGVVFLLFMIGLNYSLHHLRGSKPEYLVPQCMQLG